MAQGRNGKFSTRGGSLESGRPTGSEARAGRRLRALTLASLGALLTLPLALAPVAPAQEGPQEQEIGLLFAQTANRGKMKPIQGTPRFNLKLHGVNSQVVWFSDRPARQSGHIPVREFTRSWAGFGFVEDSPNAALTLLRARDNQDTVVVELGRPHFRKKKNTVRYSVQLLDEATGNLSHLESDRDPRVPRRFRSPSLFIDDATASVINDCVIQPHTLCERADLGGAVLTGVDLRGADLFGANLFVANLARANLSEANLSEADLRGAILSEANLSEADLSQAGLRGANLSGADLRDANLFGANLFGANLTRADLRFADLTGADLTVAVFCQTRMPNGSINNRDC